MALRVQSHTIHIYIPFICRAYSTHLHKPENPAPPPPKAAVKLTSRSLISVHGPDAAKFLQGLTTTQIPLPNDPGIFSCFLNPQGRVLADAFIYPTNNSPDWRNTLPTSHSPTDPSYFLEVDANTSPHLLTSLKRRKLRSKITLRPIPNDEFETWSLWDETTTAPPANTTEISAPDNRAPGFGKRIIAPAGKPPVEAGVEIIDTTRYNLRRILWGIAEGHSEIIPESALPQQSNIDYMGGIDYKKGCYIGQELTIRTHHTGVVRKRILPVQLYTTPPPTETLTRVVYDRGVVVPRIEGGAQIKCVDKRSRAPGTLLTCVGNVGLALCRLAAMTDVRLGDAAEAEDHVVGGQFVVKAGVGVEVVYLKAVVPGWHPVGQSVSRGPANVGLDGVV